MDVLLTLDVLFMFDGFESVPPPSPPASSSGEEGGGDPYGLSACISATSFGAGDVAAVVTWLMQVMMIAVADVVVVVIIVCHVS